MSLDGPGIDGAIATVLRIDEERRQRQAEHDELEAEVDAAMQRHPAGCQSTTTWSACSREPVDGEDFCPKHLQGYYE